ncbi:FAD-binding oxidoreductase [Flexithrix dorotheae]|uniref:FAD-binding oxidoreductase n=1 Tax=Flexithrix dorotheae TaxID=70993 RepID=UPI000365AA9E|nr:FAD-binding oxidoreductase [Flexithrix dorotheae]
MKSTLYATPNQLGSSIAEADFQNFQAIFKGEIIIQGHEEYESVRLLWNKMIDKRPAIIARCSGVADVINAINFARDNNLQVSVRGGGHNVAGNAAEDNALMIDLSKMKAVNVNPQLKTCTVQGGATWRDVDHETQAFGLVCPGGVVSDTGVGGLTLGGGLSWIRRKVGMSIDNLIGAEIVLANGKFVHASATENKDLFWALRGGGGNFGVVTSFEFKLLELGPEVFFMACMYPKKEADKVLKYWVDFTRKAPNEVTSDCIFWAVPAHPNFPEELHHTPVVVLAGMYAGNPEKGAELMQPLREITTPILDMSNVYPYNGVQQMFDPFLQKQAFNSYWKCIYLDDLTDHLQLRVVKKGKEMPSPHTLISIRNLQGAISKVSPGATAFGDRSARFLLSIDNMWKDSSEDKKNIQWTRDFFNEMAGFSKGKVYFNFNFDMEGPSDMMKDSFGANYEKLGKIKGKYDPDNFFRLNANVKPLK